jgi:hypothetical protein
MAGMAIDFRTSAIRVAADVHFNDFGDWRMAGIGRKHQLNLGALT